VRLVLAEQVVWQRVETEMQEHLAAQAHLGFGFMQAQDHKDQLEHLR
jgi:hypothetical protein